MSSPTLIGHRRNQEPEPQCHHVSFRWRSDALPESMRPQRMLSQLLAEASPGGPACDIAAWQPADSGIAWWQSFLALAALSPCLFQAYFAEP